jgi:hypothetical protein
MNSKLSHSRIHRHSKSESQALVLLSSCRARYLTLQNHSYYIYATMLTIMRMAWARQ